jgi:CspA family cold shock protein
MPKGRVATFNARNGYGFITPDDGGADCFVHLSAVETLGLTTLTAGQRISYEVLVARSGKVFAINLAQD